ncbi:M1 family metallopeptidase [Dactylosporangium sp. NPDC050588]|uniref:M1 family metallopeptidase n=1 Tax=Dactylosporangium sp. NPDC050588 TaxID=3157211 RepID=UPI0033EB1122
MGRRLAAASLATLLGLAPVAPAAAAAPVTFTPGAPGLGDPHYPLSGNGGYDVRHYDLDVRYAPATDELTGHATILAAATQHLSRFDLDLTGLAVDAIRVNDRPAAWTRDGGELVITPARGLRKGQPFTVDVRYHGVPVRYSYPSDIPGEPAYEYGFIRTDDGAIIAGEPESATLWFPVNDHPRDKATYSMRLTVPEGLTAIGNGVPLGSSTRDGWTTWRWAALTPVASYLSTMAVGRFRVDQHLHDGRPTVIAVDAALAPEVADPVVGRTDEITDYLETLFGAYPMEANGAIVDRADTLWFALETQTRPTYPASYFTSGTSRYQATVVAHELTHQWFGDSVSVANWYDTWLNEGFATYGEWMWGEHDGWFTVQHEFNQFYEFPIDHPFWAPAYDPAGERPWGLSAYTRGAMTLHALRMHVGDATFFRILRTWAAERRYANGSTEQFAALASRVAGRDLRPFIMDWLAGPQKPPNPDPAPVALAGPATAGGGCAPPAGLPPRIMAGCGR